MQFSIIISATPYSQTSQDAFAFCQAVSNLDSPHTIYRIFFHDQGVLHAKNDRWLAFLSNTQIDAVFCVNAYDKFINDEIISAQVVIAGLAQLVDACHTCDRVITFAEKLEKLNKLETQFDGTQLKK